jgi:hypothetical protein
LGTLRALPRITESKLPQIEKIVLERFTGIPDAS